MPPHWLNLWPLTSYRWPVQCTQFQWLDTWKYRVIDLSRSPQKESSVTMAIHTGTLIVSHYTWWLSMWDRTLDTVIKMSNLERPVGTLLLSEFLSSPINRLCPPPSAGMLASLVKRIRTHVRAAGLGSADLSQSGRIWPNLFHPPISLRLCVCSWRVKPGPPKPPPAGADADGHTVLRWDVAETKYLFV